MAIDWMIVKHSWTHKPIGAVGFMNNQVAVIAAFYADKDSDHDGKVGVAEYVFSMFSMDGRAVADVANHAYADPDILMRGEGLYQFRGTLTLYYASGLLAEGVYLAYFSDSVGKLAGAVAGAFTSNAVKSFVIKKGMEKAVEAAYLTSVGR